MFKRILENVIMGDNGKLETKNLGQTETVDLGKAGTQPNEAGTQPNKETSLPPKPPTDFKIAEIWIRSGQIMIDASDSFWSDRCRAIGVLEFCKEIVKTAKMPEKPENKIIPVTGGIRNFVKNLRRKK